MFQYLSLYQNYLQKYYNLKTGTNKSVRQRNDSLVAEKLKQMQAFFGLKVTGKVNTDTLNLMKQPRCGCPMWLSTSSLMGANGTTHIR